MVKYPTKMSRLRMRWNSPSVIYQDKERKFVTYNLTNLRSLELQIY